MRSRETEWVERVERAEREKGKERQERGESEAKRDRENETQTRWRPLKTTLVRTGLSFLRSSQLGLLCRSRRDPVTAHRRECGRALGVCKLRSRW